MIIRIVLLTIFFVLNCFSFSFSLNLSDRITLNLKMVDMHDILTAIAKEKNYNIIIPPFVKGRITIFLDNVTIENALEVITNIAGYSYYIKDNIIFIDKKENIDKKFGPSNLVTQTFNINFSKAKDIETQIKEILSKNGKLVVDDRTNKIVVTDKKIILDKIKDIIKEIDIPTKQVMIEAKIIIVRDEGSKELGIQWGGSLVKRFTSNNFFYGIKGGTNYIDRSSTSDTSGETTGTSNTEGKIDEDFPGAGSITTAYPSSMSITNDTTVSIPSEYVVNLPTIGNPTGGIGLIFGKWGYYNLSVKLTALKTRNLAKEIAAPKVLALDNEKASIGQGVEIPYESVSDQGTETQFKDAKLMLEVTPHITSNNMISLDLNLTKDSVGQMTTDGPAINTQEISTKLLLKDGETAVIGGILGNSETQGESRVPFFSDLPLLGFFFRNQISSKSKGELLIFITPKIVSNEVYN